MEWKNYLVGPEYSISKWHRRWVGTKPRNFFKKNISTKYGMPSLTRSVLMSPLYRNRRFDKHPFKDIFHDRSWFDDMKIHKYYSEVFYDNKKPTGYSIYMKLPEVARRHTLKGNAKAYFKWKQYQEFVK